MNFDVDFSIPQRHRVRFTNDLAGRDFEVLTELMVANDDVMPPPKVLLIVDQGIAETTVTRQLVSRLVRQQPNQVDELRLSAAQPVNWLKFQTLKQRLQQLAGFLHARRRDLQKRHQRC